MAEAKSMVDFGIAGPSPSGPSQVKIAVLDPSGARTCELHCSSTATIALLKIMVKAEAGLENIALYLTDATEALRESQTVESCGCPSELYAIVLNKISLPALANVAPDELTDNQLEAICTGEEAHGGDVVDLAGCKMLQDIGCLASLQQMQELDISGIRQGLNLETLAAMLTTHTTLAKITFGAGATPVVMDIFRSCMTLGLRPAQPPASPYMETSMVVADFKTRRLVALDAVVIAAFLPKCSRLSDLDLRLNYIGQLVATDAFKDDGGWECLEVHPGDDIAAAGWFPIEIFRYDYDEVQEGNPLPEGLIPAGAFAIADALRANKTVTRLNLADNDLGVDMTSRTQKNASNSAGLCLVR
jgi:hypothetical protein